MTTNQTFTNIDNTEIMVPMMMRTNAFLNHHHSEKHKAAIVELPYRGDVSMFVVLPDDKQGLTKMMEDWNQNGLDECISQMKNSKVSLTMPRFEFEATIRLIDILVKMGMDIENSLSSLDPGLKITEAIHKSKIRVHEVGTEAAAVTTIAVTRVNLVDDTEPIIFNVDHPFAFVIRDKKSGINLFNGVLNKII
ncbi:leukocyte elastase inhibitor-like protein [Leptotrombidium deliense]|uniref:Leukocyte elastase inhibitor-like protein n=1 Tax=Leptotrombidium deliense TaxID=299467 RepID=A0A443S4G1_9ACAR|nr:leukocyte elastase inhibitor-like protein [Leptotrombidium deliense]